MNFAATSVFQELALLLAIASAIGIVGLLLRQPLIVAFIATGIIVGGDVLGVAQATEQFDLLAEVGISVLLFLVGLKLDVQIIRSLGRVAVATGLGQVAFTAIIGFLICVALGFDVTTSAYVAVALTFSSTIIIVKLLSDKRELDTLHGRIAVGFLIVQDIAVVAAMVVLSAIGFGVEETPSGLGVAGVFLSGLVMLAAVGVFIRYVAEPLTRLVARIPELLVVFALAWAVLFAAAGDWLGFGKELGGLIAGVSLASTSFRDAIASRLASLRDFLLLFFFVGLGSRLDLDLLGSQIGPAIVLSIFVLVGNPLIVMAIMGFMGYRKRTSFLAGLTVAQISEFSLVFIVLGLNLGQVAPDGLGLVTLVGLITITLSTYMIVYSHTLYRWLEPALGIFERKVTAAEDAMADPGQKQYEVILFGLGRYGGVIGRALIERGVSVLGVDFDPEAVRTWRALGLPATYGDAADAEFVMSLPLESAKVVIMATPPVAPGVTHDDYRVILMAGLRSGGFAGRIVVRCFDAKDRDRIRAAGADVALAPFEDSASHAIELMGFGRS